MGDQIKLERSCKKLRRALTLHLLHFVENRVRYDHRKNVTLEAHYSNG